MTSRNVLAWLAIALALLWVIAAAALVPTGPYSIDELVYQAMIDAYSRHGTLAIGNGIEQFQSESLKLWILVEHAGQLFPQYPSGWAIAAAPAYGVAGFRGVVVLNAIAAAGTVGLTWLAARAILDDERLAGMAALILAAATFTVDYAFGIWPHAASGFLVTAAFASIAVGGRPDSRSELAAAAIAGFALGLGANIRVDSLVAAGPLAVWVLATYRRPYATLAMMAAGVSPGLVAAAAMNLEKFGIPSPVTYGRRGTRGGSINPAFYAPLLPLLAVAGLLALSLGVGKVRRLALRPASFLLLVMALLAAAFLFPQIGKVFTRLISGFHVLVLDFQSYADVDRDEVIRLSDGTLRLWGLVKKSLLHSIPYMAGILVLGPALLRKRDHAALWLCVLFSLAWVMPFAFSQFHGGLSNNMRYLLPVLPAVSILAAASWKHVAVDSLDWRVVAGVAAIAVISVSVMPHLKGQTPDFIWEYSVPGSLAVLLSVVSVLWVLWGTGRVGPWLAKAWQGVFLACILVATASAYHFDLGVTRHKREEHGKMAEIAADLPARSLVVTFAAEAAGMRFNQAGQVTSQADWRKGTFDTTLVEDAFGSGWHVFVQGSELARLAQRAGVASGAKARFGIEPRLDFFELIPPLEAAPE